jgi:hypothetical protein
MSNKKDKLWGISVLLCAACAVFFSYKAHFNWAVFWVQMRAVSTQRILLAVVLIYLSVCLRAFRWATLLKPRKRVASLKLIGPQFIGFSCVALFGSLGDLVRPCLLARRANLPVSSLLATYTIERMFDLGALPLFFRALWPSPRRTQGAFTEKSSFT